MDNRINLLQKAYELIAEQWKIWGIESDNYNSRTKTTKIIDQWEMKLENALWILKDGDERYKLYHVYCLFEDMELESIKDCFKLRKGYQCENIEKKSKLAYKYITLAIKDVLEFDLFKKDNIK